MNLISSLFSVIGGFETFPLGEVVQPDQSIGQGIGAVEAPIARRDQSVGKYPGIISHRQHALVDYVPDTRQFGVSFTRSVNPRSAAGTIA